MIVHIQLHKQVAAMRARESLGVGKRRLPEHYGIRSASTLRVLSALGSMPCLDPPLA